MHLSFSKSAGLSVALFLAFFVSLKTGSAQSTPIPTLNQPGTTSTEYNIDSRQIPRSVTDNAQQVQNFEPMAGPTVPTAARDSETKSAMPKTDSAFSKLVEQGVQSISSRKDSESTLKTFLLFGALSLAPAVLLMTTCYIRIIVVLSLLRQAFGAQQLPPTQILTALSMFVTLLVMMPVWSQVKQNAIDPYTAAESTMTWDEAWQAGSEPVKAFMSRQIDQAGNSEAIALFYRYSIANRSRYSQTPSVQTDELPTSYSEVPLNVILPAFVISELKVAFLLGFQIYLPFLILDLVVSSLTVSMGMFMLPPTMVSFPLKLILFVMVDGWNLVIGMLLQSFG